MSELTTGGAARGSLRAYLTGFVLSFIMTITAFFLVWRHVNSGHEIYSHNFLVALILALAIVQLAVQLVCFLHLGRESKPKWNLVIFSFMAVVLIILVFGSLWIMYSLNYHHQPPPSAAAKTDQSIIKDEGITPH